MESKIKSVIAYLHEWNSSLELPLQQDTLEQLWHEQVNAQLKSLKKLQKEKAMLVLKANSLSLISAANAEYIHSRLGIIIDEYLFRTEQMEFKLAISRPKDLFHLLEIILRKGEILLNQQYERIYPSSSVHLPWGKVSEFYQGKVLQLAEKCYPYLFEASFEFLDSLLQSCEADMRKSFVKVRFRTVRDSMQAMQKCLESFAESLKTSFQQEYDLQIPQLFYSQYVEKARNIARGFWIDKNKTKIQSLEEKFAAFAATVLYKLIYYQITLFDENLIPLEARINLAALMMLCIKDSKNTPKYLTVMDSLFEFLRLDDDQIDSLLALHSSSNKKNLLDQYIGDWNASTNPRSQSFALICLVLVLSDTYKVVCHGFEADYLSYPAWRRHWLRRFVHESFEKKVSEYLAHEEALSEFTLLLVTEELIDVELKKKEFSWTMDESTYDATDQARKILQLPEAKHSTHNKNIVLNKENSVSYDLPDLKVNSFIFECVNERPALHITLVVCYDSDFSASVSGFFAQRKTYGIRWDSGEPLAIGNLTPASQVQAVCGVDYSAFARSYKETEVLGKVLASLIDSNLFAYANISLIGVSLGARIVHSCLKEVSEGKICDVILVGAATTSRKTDWKKCREKAAGRIVNVHSSSDHQLSLMFGACFLEKAAGNYPIEVEGVENFELHDYRKNFSKILKHIRYNT